jgi:hypothetical protein
LLHYINANTRERAKINNAYIEFCATVEKGLDVIIHTLVVTNGGAIITTSMSYFFLTSIFNDTTIISFPLTSIFIFIFVIFPFTFLCLVTK